GAERGELRLGPWGALPPNRLAQRPIRGEEVVVDERRRLVHHLVRLVMRESRILAHDGRSLHDTSHRARNRDTAYPRLTTRIRRALRATRRRQGQGQSG